MNYLNILSEDDIEFICSRLTHKYIIGYFKKHPKDFAKICPGFQPQKISPDRAISLFVTNKNHPFIASFIEGIILQWMDEINSNIEKYKDETHSKEYAYARTLPHSVFSGNVNLYFRLAEIELDDNLIDIIIATCDAVDEMVDDAKTVLLEKEHCKSEVKSLRKQLESAERELNKYKLRLEKKNAETMELKHQDNKANAASSQIQRLQNNIDTLRNELERTKNKNKEQKSELASLKSQLSESRREIMNLLKKAERQQEEERKAALTPISPIDMDEFVEQLGYNFESLGVKTHLDLVLNYIRKILFLGIPIVCNHSTGKVIATCVSNALIGKSEYNVLSSNSNTTSDDVIAFINRSSRIVVLDNFIGNFNETELMPIISMRKDKIFIVTSAYDRSLAYLSKEFISYCFYLNFNNIGAFYDVQILYEEGTIFCEEQYSVKTNMTENRYTRIFREICKELDYPLRAVEQRKMLINDEYSLIGILLFDILPYCRDVMQENPLCLSERLKNYVKRSSYRDLFLRWFNNE